MKGARGAQPFALKISLKANHAKGGAHLIGTRNKKGSSGEEDLHPKKNTQG